MKESKSNAIIGFLAGIVVMMLLFHVGMWSVGNRSNAASQAPASLPTATIAISSPVNTAAAPGRPEATSRLVEADDGVRHFSKPSSALKKVLKMELQAASPRPAAKPGPSELRVPTQPTQLISSPQRFASSADATTVPTALAPPRKSSKTRKVFAVLGKAVLANVNSGQAVLGDTAQAISQPSVPSAQVAGLGFPTSNAQALPIPPSAANRSPEMTTFATTPSTPAITPASGGRRNKFRRFFGVLGNAARVEIGSGTAPAGEIVQPVVTPILPPNAKVKLREDRCKADITQTNAVQAAGELPCDKRDSDAHEN